MGVKEKTGAILDELKENLTYLQEEQPESLVELILNAGHIFTAGAGRSGLAMKAFSMRLMHLGLAANCVGEICTPHTKAGDLLIIGSGSGETESLAALAGKAKRNNLKVALITTEPNSTIAQMADTIVIMPGTTPKRKGEGKGFSSIQPMASAFEQMCLLMYDGIILELMDRMSETSESMFERHADLE